MVEEKKQETLVICQKCHCATQVKDVNDYLTRPSKCPNCNRDFKYDDLKPIKAECDVCGWTVPVLAENLDKLPSLGRCPNGHFPHYEGYAFDREFLTELKESKPILKQRKASNQKA